MMFLLCAASRHRLCSRNTNMLAQHARAELYVTESEHAAALSHCAAVLS